MRKTRLTAAVVLALVVALCAVGVATAKPQAKSPQEIRNSEKLRRAVEPAGILVHERRFQRIADANGGTRASGNPGYDASADYVAGKLRDAGYNVTRQRFEFPYFDEVSQSFSQTSPQQRTFELYDFATQTGDYDVMTYSGSGAVTNARVVPTNDVQVPPRPTPSSTSGCEPSDFTPASATTPQVALIQRGTCDFVVKAENAQAAGYDAAILFNEGQPGTDEVPERRSVLLGTLGEPGVEIPVIGISFELGRQLYAATNPRVSLDVQTESDIRETSNIIADTPGGRADRTVVVGGHLDSVPEGPGINDNGSGTATILETALQLRKIDRNPVNKLRFAFWGAEEFGLLGAEYYVANLSDRQLDQIALNLNFDMVGSPNYVRFVYDGNGSDTPLDGPTGSAEIEQTFNEYFASQGLETEPTAFDGRSDYGPFIATGIPAGGLFSGAEGIKTEEEAAVYGGTAGQAYDPCYHQACDDITNLNLKGLSELSDGVAHATYTYAEQRSIFNPNAKAAKSAAVKAYSTYKGPEARR